jgi:hypothetical protein
MVGAVLLGALTVAPVSTQRAAFPYRGDAVRLPKHLIANGYPLDNEHEQGEWLQQAVNYAIHRGDERSSIWTFAPPCRFERRLRDRSAPSARERRSKCCRIASSHCRVLALPRPAPCVA